MLPDRTASNRDVAARTAMPAAVTSVECARRDFRRRLHLAKRALGDGHALAAAGAERPATARRAGGRPSATRGPPGTDRAHSARSPSIALMISLRTRPGVLREPEAARGVELHVERRQERGDIGRAGALQPGVLVEHPLDDALRPRTSARF